MKAQGLSMQSIVVIIIAIIVLAGVIVFFFMYQGKTQKLVGQQTGYSGGKVNCASLQSCMYTNSKYISGCSSIASKCGNSISVGSSCVVSLNDGTQCSCTRNSNDGTMTCRECTSSNPC